MFFGVSHIDLPVTDFARAEAFWGKLIGLKEVKREGLADARDQSARCPSCGADPNVYTVSNCRDYLPFSLPNVVSMWSDRCEPLTERVLEVLRLVAQGLSNREISERLFLALSTVKGHTRIIFDKLQVQRRTEAVARARELGLL